MCISKSEIISLPDQKDLCAESGSACRYIELKTGGRFSSSWEKRHMVFESNINGARLLIYKKPLIGQIYALDDLIHLKVDIKNDNNYYVKMKTNKSLTELRFDMKEGEEWATAIRNKNGQNLRHLTHSVVTHKSPEKPFALLKDKEDHQAYTGSRDGFKPKNFLPLEETLSTTQTTFESKKSRKKCKSQEKQTVATSNRRKNFSFAKENKTQTDKTLTTSRTNEERKTQRSNTTISIELKKKAKFTPTKKSSTNSEEGPAKQKTRQD